QFPAQWLEGLIDEVDKLRPGGWSDAEKARLWQLMHWKDQPAPDVGRMRPETEYLLAGGKAGMTTEADLYDAIIRPGQRYFGALAQPTARDAKEAKDLPQLQGVLDHIRERILDIETKRGEPPTAATEPAGSIRSLFDRDTYFRVLRAYGKRKLSRPSWGY